MLLSPILDLVFLCDCTSSMASYLDSAQQSIKSIVEDIVAAEKSDVQFCLVQYRDHPPQDNTFVVHTSSWTGSVSKMKKLVDSMGAHGGGDGPEAVTAALHAARHLTYRKSSVKIAVLIADAPPHGLGESGDGFPNGDPDGRDPLKICEEMADLGIVIYSVAVEPNLGGYKFARDFMRAIAKLTGGQFLPLTNAKLLPRVIAGGAAEELALNRITDEIEKEIVEMKKSKPTMSEAEVVTHVTETLQKKGVTTGRVEIDDIYTKSWDMGNVDMMIKGKSLAAARTSMKADLNSSVQIKAEYSSSGTRRVGSKRKSGTASSISDRKERKRPAAMEKARKETEELSGSLHASREDDEAPKQKVSYSSKSISSEQVSRIHSRWTRK